jgi:hypothetical protein
VEAAASAAADEHAADLAGIPDSMLGEDQKGFIMALPPELRAGALEQMMEAAMAESQAMSEAIAVANKADAIEAGGEGGGEDGGESVGGVDGGQMAGDGEGGWVDGGTSGVVGADLVGNTVSILWRGQEAGDRWFTGEVTDFDAERGMHFVQYEDGDQQWYDLVTVKFKLLRGGAAVGAANEAGNVVDTGDTAPSLLDFSIPSQGMAEPEMPMVNNGVSDETNTSSVPEFAHGAEFAHGSHGVHSVPSVHSVPGVQVGMASTSAASTGITAAAFTTSPVMAPAAPPGSTQETLLSLSMAAPDEGKATSDAGVRAVNGGGGLASLDGSIAAFGAVGGVGGVGGGNLQAAAPHTPEKSVPAASAASAAAVGGTADDASTRRMSMQELDEALTSGQITPGTWPVCVCVCVCVFVVWFVFFLLGACLLWAKVREQHETIEDRYSHTVLSHTKLS